MVGCNQARLERISFLPKLAFIQALDLDCVRDTHRHETVKNLQDQPGQSEGVYNGNQGGQDLYAELVEVAFDQAADAIHRRRGEDADQNRTQGTTDADCYGATDPDN